MATLMMEAARLSGVAARFASGYLHGRASMAGHASTHAWAEVYLPTLGWRGFDPTIGGTTTANHIVTGVSTHPRGVMPVSGIVHRRIYRLRRPVCDGEDDRARRERRLSQSLRSGYRGSILVPEPHDSYTSSLPRADCRVVRRCPPPRRSLAHAASAAQGSLRRPAPAITTIWAARRVS